MQENGRGTCNRHAPRPDANREPWAHWPTIISTNWCGEWEAPPRSDDELFEEYLLRTPATFTGIPDQQTWPIPPIPGQGNGPTAPLTYDAPFEDPI